MNQIHGDFTLKDFWFSNVKLTDNPEPDKYSYSGCVNRLDPGSFFPYPVIDSGKNVTIFGVDKSSSVDIDYKKIYTLSQCKYMSFLTKNDKLVAKYN